MNDVPQWRQTIHDCWGADSLPVDQRIPKGAEMPFLWMLLICTNPDRWCTDHGLDEQLLDFKGPVGIVYYWDYHQKEMCKIAARINGTDERAA